MWLQKVHTMTFCSITQPVPTRALICTLCVLAFLHFSFGSPILYNYRADGTRLSSLAAAELILRGNIRVQLATLIYGDEHQFTAQARNGLALAYEDQGRFSDADRLLQEAVYKRARTHDRERRDNLDAIFCGNLAELRAFQGRYAEAEWLYREDLRLWAQTFVGNSCRSPDTVNKLAGVCIAQKKYAEAEKLCKEIIGNEIYSDGVGDTILAMALNNLGTIYVRQKRFTEAWPLYQETLRLCQVEEAIRKGQRFREFADIGRLRSLRLLYGQPSSASVNDEILDLQLRRFVDSGRKHHRFKNGA
jgi:tetratricopeptide (TPR) repeat protein